MSGPRTLNWSDVIDIGPGLWDDVTRCRLAEREWGLAAAIHPAFDGPQSVVICGGAGGGFVESAQWDEGQGDCDWSPAEVGALVSRGPLTVWRKPLAEPLAQGWLDALVALGVPSLEDAGEPAPGELQGMRIRVFFRHGSYDHAFGIGEHWREPALARHRALIGLLGPHLRPSLRLYFGGA